MSSRELREEEESNDCREEVPEGKVSSVSGKDKIARMEIRGEKEYT